MLSGCQGCHCFPDICLSQQTLDLKAFAWLEDDHNRLWNHLLQEGDLGLRACESLYS